MEQQAATSTRTDQEPRSHDESAAPARPGRRPVFGLVSFGLLLTVTLAIDGFADVAPMPGTALVMAGMMLVVGVADLLDPAARRLAAGVRLGGMAMAVLGIAVQIFG